MSSLEDREEAGNDEEVSESEGGQPEDDGGPTDVTSISKNELKRRMRQEKWNEKKAEQR